jgi:hypothetical protein
MLTLGNQYTREEIASELGGSAIEYLPRVNGIVVCACLRLDYNPDAPKIILAGFGPQIEESAEMLCKQRGIIPVFIKRQQTRGNMSEILKWKSVRPTLKKLKSKKFIQAELGAKELVELSI